MKSSACCSRSSDAAQLNPQEARPRLAEALPAETCHAEMVVGPFQHFSPYFPTYVPNIVRRGAQRGCRIRREPVEPPHHGSPAGQVTGSSGSGSVRWLRCRRFWPGEKSRTDCLRISNSTTSFPAACSRLPLASTVKAVSAVRDLREGAEFNGHGASGRGRVGCIGGNPPSDEGTKMRPTPAGSQAPPDSRRLTGSARLPWDHNSATSRVLPPVSPRPHRSYSNRRLQDAFRGSRGGSVIRP